MFEQENHQHEFYIILNVVIIYWLLICQCSAFGKEFLCNYSVCFKILTVSGYQYMSISVSVRNYNFDISSVITLFSTTGETFE